MDLFPNCLVGRIITKFLIGKTTKYQYGVAILIGPRIVLTVAHNLLIDGIKADKIFFVLFQMVIFLYVIILFLINSIFLMNLFFMEILMKKKNNYYMIGV